MAEQPRAMEKRSSEAPLLTAFLCQRKFLRRIAAGMGIAGTDSNNEARVIATLLDAKGLKPPVGL